MKTILFVRLRGDVRPLADETCRRLINQQSQPEYVGARRPRLLRRPNLGERLWSKVTIGASV
jgi:hypothetical protein